MTYSPARLRALIEDRGLTLDAAAARAGMKPQHVWQIVSGKTPNPGIRTVERVVAAIGATMAELYADEE